MSKDSMFSIIRLVLTAAGSYLIGTNVFGADIDSSLWETLAGTFMTTIGVIWGIADKSASIEKIQSGVRSVVAVVGGLLVSSGKLRSEALDSILGIIAIVIPYIQSQTSKKKIRQIETGKISTNQLKS